MSANVRFLWWLVAAVAVALVLGVILGETPLTVAQYLQALSHPSSGPGEIIWTIRAPRAFAAAVVGGALGLAGAVMQGLLRNPLADPGVLGVSALAGLGAALAIALGLAIVPGAVELAALIGALAAGAAVAALAARFREPEVLILFGVALSAFGGALTSLVFNLSPSPVANAEILSWLLGSVANRDWSDIAWAAGPMALGVALSAYAARGLTLLSIGRAETAALLAGAAVAMAGIIGFVGLAAPHLVRARAGHDPGRTLLPSALMGAVLLVLADLIGRILPTETELKLGVVTALFGAPLFALAAWRASRAWRS